MAKKKTAKNNIIKKRIIITCIVIVAVVALLFGWLYARMVNLPQYLETRTRCSASSIVTGYETPLRYEKRYYPQGDDHNSGVPGAWEVYFCSNREAEDAGYQVYTDLRIRN